MKISVVGTGYVGLVSGVCLAEVGHEVVCVDNLPDKVDKINAGEPPIYERDLDKLLKSNVGSKLVATTDLRKAVLESDLSLIAVGTPFDGSEIDLSYIEQVSREIGAALKEKESYHVVVVKSTVVPGTTINVVMPILEQSSGKKAGEGFGVGMNPEFLREGEAIDDFMYPDRIVLGGIDDKTLEVMDQLYSVFDKVDIIRTNPSTAELIKYCSNSLLATMISFANEIGNLAASIDGVDVVEVMRGVHLDKRLSPITETHERIMPVITTYLEAGCGFGGSCFPKDVNALIAYGKNMGLGMSVLDSVIKVNAAQPQRVIDLISKHYSDFKGLKVAILGLAFKPGTDDMRESPAIPVVNGLLDSGADVRAYDPIAQEEAEKVFADKEIHYSGSLDDVTSEVDVVVLMTRWPEFNQLPEILSSKDPSPLLVDGRRMIDKSAISRYEGIGL